MAKVTMRRSHPDSWYTMTHLVNAALWDEQAQDAFADWIEEFEVACRSMLDDLDAKNDRVIKKKSGEHFTDHELRTGKWAVEMDKKTLDLGTAYSAFMRHLRDLPNWEEEVNSNDGD